MIEWREGTGSFVALPEEAASAWPGGPEGQGLCERVRLRRLPGDVVVLGHVGVLELGEGSQGLALGDEHSPLAYLAQERLFVRWLWVEDLDVSLDGLVDLAVRALPSLDWEEGPPLRVSGALLVFDADRPGAEASVAEDTLVIAPGPGRYRVDTCSFQPDDVTRIDLHRLVAVPAD